MSIHIQSTNTYWAHGIAWIFLGWLDLTSGGCGPRFTCQTSPPPEYGAALDVARGSMPAVHLAYDPQDARIAIDPESSTYCYEYYGEGWQAAVSGTIDLTIEPGCIGPTCTLTVSKIKLSAPDFDSGGHRISHVDIWSDGYSLAIWKNDDTFALPKESFDIYVGYKNDGLTGGHNDLNLMNLSWGNTRPGLPKILPEW